MKKLILKEFAETQKNKTMHETLKVYQMTVDIQELRTRPSKFLADNTLNNEFPMKEKENGDNVEYVCSSSISSLLSQCLQNVIRKRFLNPTYDFSEELKENNFFCVR
ncbi:hypothetical protein TNIN_289121 [Trichonephila inaurata madagascariensis]|uniref:Uncharacterized protein n=1 Tax=Trichonephila inaurata madagascariensis TaxID=2747483 RepID=A0A8X7CDE2_9ARAC|nr:hypothetical protein TNIN_289121 [Trichonephila inaurata madagascariensis]